MTTATQRVRVEEAAVMLGVSVRVVYSLARAGKLTLFKDAVLRRTWLDRGQVERLAAERLQPAPASP
jgi:excisionase family DNA binding protein